MFGNRFNRSWRVARESYAVLRGNPALAIFPLLSTIATVVVSLPFLGALFLTYFHGPRHETPISVAQYAITAGMYLANYFVVIFFNAALVACANENLQGRPTNVAFGVNAAMRRLPQILGWALLASTVGMILRAISERSGLVGTIVSSLVGMLWNVAVFFVVPVLVLERQGPFAALKSSVGMIKQTWGERVILGIGVGVAMGVLSLLVLIPVAIAVALFAMELYVLGAVAVVATLLVVLALSVVGSAMTTIYQTALYLYCRNGAVAAGFERASFEGAFAPKPAAKLFRR